MCPVENAAIFVCNGSSIFVLNKKPSTNVKLFNICLIPVHYILERIFTIFSSFFVSASRRPKKCILLASDPSTNSFLTLMLCVYFFTFYKVRWHQLQIYFKYIRVVLYVPCDALIRHDYVIDMFTGCLSPGDIAVAQHRSSETNKINIRL